MSQDAVAQRGEYWRMEDALVEKAAKLLTSKVRKRKGEVGEEREGGR